MAFTTIAKNSLNHFLGVVNLRIETLTGERVEQARLHKLATAGHFDNAVFPVPPGFHKAGSETILGEVAKHERRFESFESSATNDVGYCFDNDYFGSPDTEVLYAIIRQHAPARIVEVGSGNSTKIARQAIIDGKLKTRLVSIDPQPRIEVDSLADEIVRRCVEGVPDLRPFQSLAAGDILFIDSSHEVKVGNDCLFLYLKVLADLQPGVLVHIHDIFLPYEYPKQWLADFRWNWTEQYLVQAMLMFNECFEVLWPGHFLQKTMPAFCAHFPRSTNTVARSLWLRVASSS